MFDPIVDAIGDVGKHRCSICKPIESAGIEARHGVAVGVGVQVFTNAGWVTPRPDAENRMVLAMKGVIEARFMIVLQAGVQVLELVPQQAVAIREMLFSAFGSPYGS